MEVILAKYSGFCFGVKRAVDLVEKALREKRNQIYSIGPFIHNPQVIARLSRQGLKLVRSLKDIKRGCLVIRSHGVHPSLIKEAREKKLGLIDVTCPYVIKAQNISQFLKREGYKVVIVGEEEHPEVQALKGFAEDKALVVNSEDKMPELNLSHAKIGVIAQTTQSRNRYLKILSQLLIKNRFREIRIFDTICADTIKRQNSALQLARRVEVMFVLGGRGSANTKRLAEICRNTGTPTYHIEESKEVKSSSYNNKRKIGIASGASTPDWIIDKVKKRLCP